jgi:hypothetical protein
MATVNIIPIFYTFLSDFLAFFLKFSTIFYDWMWTLKLEHSPADIMTTVSTLPIFYSIFLDFSSISSNFMRTRKRSFLNLYTFVWLC